jgi:RNA recognition motif-containing protein
MNIFVAKLSFQTKDDSLRNLFEQYGQVNSVRIISDKENRRSKGFGFVEMPNDDEAYRAIQELNDATLDGRQIVVKESSPKSE